MKSLPSMSVFQLLLLIAVSVPAGADDRGRRYPITLDTTKVTNRDFDAMHAEVTRMNDYAARSLHRVDGTALADGEISAETGRYGAYVLERTVGLAFVPLETFLGRMPADRWGPNLVDYRGGEIRRLGAGRQVERMVLAAPLQDLDMTKIETVQEFRDRSGALERVVVTWKVLKSDNGSVIQDIGSVTFARAGSGRTRITWLSGHQLNSPLDHKWMPDWIRRPLQEAQKWIVAGVLSSYFTRATRKYREDTGGEGASILDRLRGK